MGWVAFGYGLFLVAMGWWVAKRRGTDLGAFYNAHRQAHWVWAGISMIGTAISGLTFLSLPGAVRQDGWTYLQVLLGYLVGYTLVALLLLPRYYQLSRASIYEYFRHQLGPQAEKVAAITFLISRLLASSVRLYLALIVLQLFFPQVPFPVLGLLSLMLIYIYAERGGTGTIIYTDLLQTLLFLGAGGLTLLYILTPEVRATLRLPTIIDLSIDSRHYFWKDFLGGVLLSFTMTGLDQDQMQKSLSMPDVTSAQRMIGLYAGLLVPVKLLFLLLGSALWAYVEVNGYPIPARSDQLYASLAQQVFPLWVGAMFVVGLVSSTLSSVDGALVALTTVTLRSLFPPSWEKLFVKKLVFVSWALLSWGITVYFYYFPPERYALDTFLKLGGYTYGPLLGLFLFSLMRGVQAEKTGRSIPWVMLGGFGAAIGLERGLSLDLGYGVIVWVAVAVLGGLLLMQWAVGNRR